MINIKIPKIAFLVFSALDKKDKLILENLEISLETNLWSGFLLKKGIENDILLFLLSEKNRENNQNVYRLVDYCKKENYDFIFISADCPFEISEVIKKKLKRKVFDLSAIEKKFNFHPNFLKQFYPNFGYKIWGAQKVPILRAASLLLCGCHYSQTIKNNYLYRFVNFKKWKGCSYCSSALSYKVISIRSIKKQIEILKKSLPHLKLIEIPTPLSRDFLSIISVLLKDGDLNSLSLYVFFRPDDLVSNKEKIESLLKIMAKKDCSFIIENLGLENFSKKELAILNRGYGPEKNIEALKIFDYFKKKYPKIWRAERTSVSFILFGPFTEIKDLRINADYMTKFREYFFSFRRINFNKLRIEDDTPIYHLVKKAGLILKKNGYLDYRFNNPEIGRIYEDYIRFSKLFSTDQQKAISFLIRESKF